MLALAKVLITGGAGFIGYHLSKHLAGKGDDITICDNLFRGKSDENFKELTEKKNVSYICCDLTDFNEFKKLENDYQYVFNLAAINGTRNFYEIPHKVLRVNTLIAINILDWFITTKCKKIFFPSSSEAYSGTMAISKIPIPTPEDVALSIEDVYNERKSYAGSKIIGELLFINYARKYKFEMSIVRYHNIYGPRMGNEHVMPQFISRILNKENPFKIFGGRETRAFCYVDDAIKASELVMKSKNTNMEIINIGNGKEEISMIDLAWKLFAITGYKADIAQEKAPKGTAARRCPSTKKLIKLTNFSPDINLDYGLKKTFEWYKNKRD